MCGWLFIVWISWNESTEEIPINLHEILPFNFTEYICIFKQLNLHFQKNLKFDKF